MDNIKADLKTTFGAVDWSHLALSKAPMAGSYEHANGIRFSRSAANGGYYDRVSDNQVLKRNSVP